MGSQFVDLNADGHADYLSATFDGSPHVAWGSATGFREPERLLDTQGRRLCISYIWDYDQRKHTSVGWAMPDGQPAKERCISALAFDWDADGDLDLLLGSYEGGHLYLQRNEGTKTEPRFPGRNTPVMAGGVPFGLPAKMTTPQLVDWDGDGDLDLVAGTFGDSYGAGVGGAVFISLNRGKPGAPAFGPLTAIIPAGAKGGHEPTRPDAGLYPHVVDWDGDGDLDLVVGGYSMWMPQARALTPDEQARVQALQADKQAVQDAMRALVQRINDEVAKATEGQDPTSEAARAARADAFRTHNAALSALRERSSTVQAELDTLVPRKQRTSFVWFYERR